MRLKKASQRAKNFDGLRVSSILDIAHLGPAYDEVEAH
jgi:hypothetical protein